MKMMCLLIAYIWVYFQNIFTQVNGQFYYCSDAYSCYGQSLAISLFLECNGYHSCGKADIALTASSTINCAGSYACFAATKLTTLGAVSCRGLFSCAYVNYIYPSSSDTYCYGEQSCVNSTIYDTSGRDVRCYGALSCYGATLYISGDAQFEGFYSGENAVVSSSDSSIFVQLYSMCGNVTVICNSGHTCTIDCYESGCNRAIFNGTGTFIFDCNNNPQESDACPGSSGRVLSSFMLDEGYNEFISDPTIQTIGAKLSPLEKGSIDSNDNVYDPCNETTANAIHCANDSECTSINVTNHIGPICCSGSDSCNLWSNIKTTTSLSVLNSSDIIDNTAIRCDGYWSCKYGTILANVGDIFYSASGGGTQSSAESGNNGNIYVTGNSGGTFSDFSGDTVYCLVEAGCWASTIYESENIWVVGSRPFARGTAFNITNEIYCHGERSCEGTSFTNVGNSIYAAGYKAMGDTTISNIGGGLLGWGRQVFSNISLVNAIHVCVNEKKNICVYPCARKLVLGCLYNAWLFRWHVMELTVCYQQVLKV